MFLLKELSINYFSTFEGGGGRKMLMVADVGEGGLPKKCFFIIYNFNVYVRKLEGC